MPNNSRQVALHTWLMLVPVLLLVMGAINGLAAWQLPAGLHPPHAGLPLMLLVGAGLLAVLRQRLQWARLCGALILPFGLHASLQAWWPALLELPLPWQAPLTPATGIAMLVVAACLLSGNATPRGRHGWRLGGGVIVVIGAVSLLSALWPERFSPGPWGSVFATPFTSLPALLAGTAMWMMARQHVVAPMLSRVAILALVGSVLASGLAWYALTWQQHDAKRRHAAELLSSFKVTAERVLDGQQRELQRMASRWTQFENLPPMAYREAEAAAAFRDLSSLVSLHWQSETERFPWGRDRSDAYTLLDCLTRHDWLLDWLAVGGTYPRWVLPDLERPELALVSVPLPGDMRGQLVAAIDLSRLLREEIRALVTPLTLSIERQSASLMANREHGGDEVVIEKSRLILPGGVTVEIHAHNDGSSFSSSAGWMPLGVAVGGWVLSYLLAFNLGMVNLGRRRSLALVSAQRHLRAQQRVQTLIARDQPLSDTLRAICRLVESQANGAISSIMLCDDEQKTLDRIYSVNLPERYLAAVRGVPIGPGMGACGHAAYVRDFAICVDIARDPRWRGYRDVAEEHRLRACWSYPVIASDGRVLGTFATYYRQPREPSRSDRRHVIEAAELVSLAVERERNRRALLENEQRYRSLFTYHPDAVFSLDLEGYFVTANAACSGITGYTLEELQGLHFAELIEPAERERIEALFRKTSQGEAFRHSLTIKRRDGGSAYLDLTHLPIVINDKVMGLYGIAKDMTERHRWETELRILQRSVEASINGIIIADAQVPDMPIIYANEAFERITGYRRSEILGRNCRVLQGSESDPTAIARLRQAITERREINVTLCNYRKDGTPFWNNLYLAPVRDGEGRVTHFVGVQHDISERKAYEAKLSFHASHDALTGLANRSLFESHLLHEVPLAQRHGRQLAVLFVDLDDFKPINDSLGHEVGDQVLIQVSQRLADELAPGDTLARFGGDEFVILLPKLHQEEAAVRLAERLLTCIGRPYRVEEHEFYIGASVGIAFLHDGLHNPVELIQQADMAMYRAKQRGRNAWECFTDELNDEVSARMALRNDLQEAIEAGSFELHYQPLLDAGDESVLGFEALVRWKHPVRGYLSPGTFIPLAEDTGQIGPISEWVLRQACRDMCRLSAEGYGQFRVSVNLSPLQFRRANFLANLQQVLRETGLSPQALELELTEGVLMTETATAVATLHRLREMGVEVSIDDFGTGFSSLSYLKQLPIGKIKIDRSFIRDVTTHRHDGAIVQGIISMAHHLGLTVVAEGIEEPQQRDFLAAHGCDVFQGFLFARPMPLDRLRRYLNERRPRRIGAKDPLASADK